MVQQLNEKISEKQRQRLKAEMMQALLTSEEYSRKIEHTLELAITAKATGKESEEEPAVRRAIGKLIDEIFTSQTEKLEKRVKIVESVLFKTSESDRSRLFDHIYQKIANARQESENDDKKLESSIDLLERKLASFELRIDANDRKTSDVTDLCNQVSKDYQKTNDNVQEWYSEFMAKVTNQHK